ncbi:CDF family Co(II)/Ni(II) efflux transporter DmeF [Methylomicrobium lacus]|uniref:CDF family Co(II)/Ni(II) efflux transporter DmeF n=1 Tax=Methylomicrobium lacus TaxID=136992 RepID=UPI0035A9620D
MHARTIGLLQHDHNFALINKKGERRTRQVLALSIVTMVLEIVAGLKLGSMALLADGWHMGTHVAAFLITLLAYRYTRAHLHDETFAFSSGKVGVLGAFASSIALGIAALLMLVESGNRFFHPHAIHFDEAIAIAGIGLGVNLICALLLKDHHHVHDHHGDPHVHHDHDHHHDHNLKAAYLHVLADALTSLLAIAALVLGKVYGWGWLDPAMGVVGAIIITRWSYALVKETSPVLLDESLASDYRQAIVERIESDADNRVADLHIWRIAPNHYALIVSIVTHDPKNPQHYKNLLKKFNRLGGLNKLSHVTVEVTRCRDTDCA